MVYVYISYMNICTYLKIYLKYRNIFLYIDIKI